MSVWKSLVTDIYTQNKALIILVPYVDVHDPYVLHFQLVHFPIFLLISQDRFAVQTASVLPSFRLLKA